MLGRWHRDSGTRSARQAASDACGCPSPGPGACSQQALPLLSSVLVPTKSRSHNRRHLREGQSPGSGRGEGLAQSCMGAVVRQRVGLPHAPGPWAQVWLWAGEDAKATAGRWQAAKCGRGLWHGKPTRGSRRGEGHLPDLRCPGRALRRCGPTSQATGWVAGYALFRGWQRAAQGPNQLLPLSAAVGTQMCYRLPARLRTLRPDVAATQGAWELLLTGTA